MKFLKPLLITFIAIILFLIGIVLGFAAYNLSNLTTSISKNYADLGISKEDYLNATTNSSKEENSVKNIALFGIDTRNQDGSGRSRSDSIIIATIDMDNKKIKLSSIMRDTRVAIENHGMDKINHAYAYGGPQLAIKTLNQNFGLNITDFVTVNFFGFEKIIDSIGGVELNIKSYEIDEINKYIKEVAKIQNKKPKLITSAGTQKLNGIQALAYGRIRKVGNGDFERTDRQRAIILAAIEKLKTGGVAKAIKLASESSSFLKTSLTMPQMIKLGTEVLQNINSYTIEQDMFPRNGQGKKFNGVWYMYSDLDVMKNELHSFIYEQN